MQVVSKTDFDRLSAHDPYYAGRWPYFEKAGRVVMALRLFGPVLEIGPYRFPLVIGSDTMDIRDIYKPTFQWNAGCPTWPVKDKTYDLLIGLQVWEHLGENQHVAFSEACRVSKWILLSFPFKWNCPKDKIHHGIGPEKISSWTNGMEYMSWHVGNRVICLFHVGEEKVK